MMSDLVIIDEETLKEKIYTIRGLQVMLDRDLAKLYKVETKVFNQAVKRNIKRFPDDFMFQLSKNELENWRSQFVTSNSDKMGLRRLPFGASLKDLGKKWFAFFKFEKGAIEVLGRLGV